MGTEDFIDLHAYNSTDTGNEANELHNSFSEPSEVDCQPSCSQDKEDTIIEKVEEGIINSVNVDFQHVQDMDLDEDLVQKRSILEVNVKLTETIAMEEKMIKVNSATNGEMGSPAAQNGSAISNHMIDGGSAVTGVKRARVTYSYGNPSVHAKYNSLTRASKRKLEELLQQWSQWHAQNVSSSDDSKEALESGEGTYFPAIHVGLEKSSTMSFWMDNQTNKQQSKEFIPLDGDSVPLYDRGYASVLTSADGSAHSER
nr:TPA_asm: hypothetical protein HUJ06_004025 [Nelumbo nucifera]